MKSHKLEKHYLLSTVTECNSTWVTEETLLLTTRVLKHEKELAYDIVNITSYNVILEYL